MPTHTCTLGVSNKAIPKINKPSLIASYGTWLNSYKWDYYCTFTTRYQLTIPAARRMMSKLQEQLTRQYMDKPTIFWVAEPFDTKYGCHIHALLLLPGKVKNSIIDIRNVWQVVSKGRGLREFNNTTIKPYDPIKGGHFYLSKYLHLQAADYDLL